MVYVMILNTLLNLFYIVRDYKRASIKTFPYVMLVIGIVAYMCYIYFG